MERQIEDLVANPQKHFDNPQDVLLAGDLADDVKRRILESWKLDAARLAESTAENMAGGEESDLREVSKALTQLNAAPRAEVRRPVRVWRAGLRLSMMVGAIVGAGVGLVFLAAAGWSAMPPALLLLETTVIGALIGGIASAIRKVVRI